MASQEQLEKMHVRQDYRNTWHTDLCHAMSVDCSYCCLALWCAPCVSYLLRKRALYDDMSRYTCCAGYFPCSGRCGESKCPELCLWTEVCFCFVNSVASTRFLLQDEFNIQTTQCDNCIIGFMICIQQLACIFSIIACILGSEELNEAARILSCLAELVYCSVCPCMQTQHKIELDKRDGKFDGDHAMTVPTVQHMSRIDQPVPPSVGYPQPPPPYGQPYPGGHGYPHAYQPYGQPYPPPLGYPPSGSHPQGYPYPPPQHQGYPYPPPQGYPPHPQGSPQLQGYPYPPQGHPPYPQGSPQHQGYPYPPQPQGDNHHPQGHPHSVQGDNHQTQGHPHSHQGDNHQPPQGYLQPPQGDPHQPPQGDPHQPPQGYPHLPPQGHHHHTHKGKPSSSSDSHN